MSAPRVVVVAEGYLVGEAIEVALSARDFEIDRMASPRSRQELVEARREISRIKAGVGLVVAEIDDLGQWRDALALIESVRMRWLVVTGSRNPARWGALVAAGCQGVVPMSAGLDVLTRTLWAVSRGGPGMPQSAREEVLAEWERLGTSRRSLILRISALSPREWQVLEQLKEGHSIKAIAETGGVSEGTVRSQVRAIRQKLNVKSQLAAVAAYQQATELNYGQTG
ncbi:helix-turn-helix transcriptional regulator [Nocardioides campestrisoli]|uniref:helix-turn-helix transcriptional regulator n=1 Tax=Nocardioides campestrisoli TaxID=2736757 RepID=UPI0015E69065|nr:response regulator transcription factor [Nocardioides campestrisoli]